MKARASHAWVAAGVAISCLIVAACNGGSARSDPVTTLFPVPTNVPSSTTTVPPRLEAEVALASGVTSVRSGAKIPVRVKVTNRSTKPVGVGVCLYMFNAYAAFVDARTGRTVSPPDDRDVGCFAIAFYLQPGHSRTYAAHAVAQRRHGEGNLPPGRYLLALRPFAPTPVTDLQPTKPIPVTIVA